MVIGLLTASLLSIVCFLYTGWLGFAVHGPADIGNHFLYGFFTTFLVTLAQSMTMFFFIGTGKQVKELVVNDAKGPEFVKRTKQFKAKTFPPMLWAMIFTMATMIVGGGVHTQVLPGFHLGAVHGVLATIALYYNLVATWRNAKYMIEHNMLMEEVEKRLVASPASK
jgi:hypothetical protein